MEQPLLRGRIGMPRGLGMARPLARLGRRSRRGLGHYLEDHICGAKDIVLPEEKRSATPDGPFNLERLLTGNVGGAVIYEVADPLAHLLGLDRDKLGVSLDPKGHRQVKEAAVD